MGTLFDQRIESGFSLKAYGHAALSDMVRAYPELLLTQENNAGHWARLKPKAAAPVSASATAS